MTITVSTDGSALGNPNGPMGWAWADHQVGAARTDGHAHDGDSDAGGATNGTNQIGELVAVLQALRAHPGDEPLVIETDSQYAINCSTKWVHGWKKNGWKNSQKKPVKNAPLIKAIDQEISIRPASVKFVWVKGHNGNPGNEKVDDLAHGYSGDCRAGVKDGYLPLEGWQSLIQSDYAKGLDIPSDAQLLLDGKITPEEYQLGRGSESQEAEPPHAASNARTDGDEPHDTLPEDMSAGAEAYSKDEDSEAATSDTAPAQGETGQSGRPAQSDQPNQPNQPEQPNQPDPSDHEDQENQEPASKSTADRDRQEPAGVKDQHSSARPAQSPDAGDGSSTFASPVAQEAQVSIAPSPSIGTVTGLTVSGQLLFSPPPSSSPSYDGRPKRIHGLVEIEGDVDGRGRIRIEGAQFRLL
ncbi:ribonuclease HI [Bifidobacterium aemilianum]|uniref:ribonuclease H n=1 Tax=Bifidobacterium aemilianum TaxID=2493120 RepID=A0A366KA29_9BIFI|nr:ribonuclease H [Bifidobacterium aemilianum]RBP97521.1 ribonuclease HI [Bifidobacterium aemilianum]